MRRTGTLKTVTSGGATTTRKSHAAPPPLLRCTCPTSRPSGMRLSLLAALLFAALTTGRANTNGSQPKVLKLHVPQIVDPRSVRVELRCEYDLCGHDLYSVNWHRNNKELFRYTPSLHPKRLAYSDGGVNVSLEESDGQRLVLLGHQQDLWKNMRAYEGSYMCEVSTEKTFQTDYAWANVSVAILPQNEPVLEGVQPYYQVGEQLEAVCTSGPSLPPAEITFYLNKDKIDRAYTQRNKTLHSVGDAAVAARASISLQLQRRHFHAGSLTVGCRATLPGVVGAPEYRTTKTATLAARNQPLAQEPPRASAAVVSVGSSVVAVGLLLIILNMGEY